jgi:lincosamide nucleotidyltransferase A/C/D/E
MVSAEDVIAVCETLARRGILVWLTGGWGMDALLGEQTRPHKDLDLIVELDDVVRLQDLLSEGGYHLKELWSENAWAFDSLGTETATAFVLTDAENREIDLHAVRFNDQGIGVPAWADREGFGFRKEDLAGEGAIARRPVRCLSPAIQVKCHTGYELPAAQVRDMELLREKFGVT